MDAEKLEYLASLHATGKIVEVEYGIESVNDRTLQRVHRGHDFACTDKAVRDTARLGLPVCGHVILGLPGETREIILEGIRILNSLPLTSLKFHQLQIIRHTRMAAEYKEHPERFHRYGVEEYIDSVIDFLEHSRPTLVFERFVSQSPPELLAVSGWGLKNYEFTAKLEKRMEEVDGWQGKLF